MYVYFVQFDELEEIGFTGFAVAFLEEKTQIVGTSSVMKCFTPQFVDYIHSVMIAGKYISY